ncbi:MAG: hypothetical protein ACNY01_09000 [Desulfobacteria bacterium]
MKDERGLYYYPALPQKNERMYVRRGATGIEFRLWNSENPKVWDNHLWPDMATIKKAAAMYITNPDYKGRNPLPLYDVGIAERLIKDEQNANQDSK